MFALRSRRAAQASTDHAPDLLPVLSRGKHRSARKGACFMELASYLAGERWSDHPKCTHPLLADLARQVNDHTADAHRSELAVLIPSVIGTSTEDLRLDAGIALICARAAVPVVAAERQNIMAVGIITAERVLARLDGRDPGQLSDKSRRALADTPLAARYAAAYTQGAVVSPEGFQRHGAPNVVRLAVLGVAAACDPSSAEILRGMLVDAIRLCTGATPAGERAVDPVAWAGACLLTARRGG